MFLFVNGTFKVESRKGQKNEKIINIKKMKKKKFNSK